MNRKSMKCVAAIAMVASCAAGCSAPGAGTVAAPASAPLAQARVRSASRAALRRLGTTIRARSRIDPAAARGRLLYVADPFANAVLVYTYPQLSGAGVLTGFSSVNGVCTDRQGYVWILDTSDVAAWEFAHGGTQPISLLTPGDTSGNPGVGSGCSISAKSGDLAVAGAGPGVTVFRNGQQTHATYWDFDFFQMSFTGYDKAGNLYVDGILESSFAHAIAEMPAGSSTFNQFVFTGGTIAVPAGIQWDGKYLDVGDGASGTIYQTNGSAILGSVATGATCQGQFYVVPNRLRVIVPDPCSASTGVYAYPTGGSALKMASGGQQDPQGAAVSVAP